VAATEPSTAEQPVAAAPPADSTAEPSRRHAPDLGRVAWMVTTTLLLVGVLVLALKRDWGYAGVSFAVALSAAINLL
jgi:hypothetical protein